MRHQLVCLSCIALLSACGDKDPDPSETDSRSPYSDPSGAWPSTQESDGGNYSVTMAPLGGPIVLVKHFSLDVKVEPKSGEAGPLEVKVDADMPAHRHGMNTQPELTAKGESRYQVDGMFFHMTGEWVITVEVTRDGTTEKATFPVLMK